MVIKLTEEAKEKLNELLEQNESDKALRIYIAGYGWGGPTFGMALEEPKDSDLRIAEDGFDFIMDEEFSKAYNEFSIGYSNSFLRRGFTIMPDRGGGTC